MAKEKPVQTLAVFLMENDAAAKRFLTVVQKIEKDDKNVKIVDAAIADRTRRGKVKVHQTEDTGGMKGGVRGGAIGVVVGAILLGPAGAVVGGAAGGILAGLHNRFRDIGIDDKFMKQVATQVDKGKSALFVLYEGDWSHSIGAIEDAIKNHNAILAYSTLPADSAAELQSLVGIAAKELGGAEVVGDYEVDVEPEPVAAAAAISGQEPDDLTKISGVGPKAAEVLVAAGIDSYARLARTSEPDLRKAFSDANTAVPRSVGTWAMQASFAEHGDWAGLAAFLATQEGKKAAKREPDDLTNLVGVGPKAAKALAAAGIKTYQALADANEPQLRKIMHDADMVAPANLATWPMQASYAAAGDWRALGQYNQKASKGQAPTKAKAAPAAAEGKPDDLTRLNGIGPRIKMILNDGGVTTYDRLQHTSTEDLREMIASGGALPPASLSTWPTQAAFAAKDDWAGLADYNKRH